MEVAWEVVGATGRSHLHAVELGRIGAALLGLNLRIVEVRVEELLKVLFEQLCEVVDEVPGR